MSKQVPGSLRASRDPYAAAPTGELSEPLLPRWFVVLAVVMVLAALAVFVVAFPLLGGDDAVPVAERRPPPEPDTGLSHDVGEVAVGTTEPQPAEAGCPEVAGLAVAGTERDRLRLQTALDAACEVGVPAEAASAVAALGDAEALIRFARFERAGVDSAVDVGGDPPRVLINARFAQVDQPRAIAPLLVHEAVMFDGEPATATTAVAARRAELAMCRALFAPDDFSSGCETAAELLALDDPAAALRDAGYE